MKPSAYDVSLREFLKCSLNFERDISDGLVIDIRYKDCPRSEFIGLILCDDILFDVLAQIIRDYFQDVDWDIVGYRMSDDEERGNPSEDWMELLLQDRNDPILGRHSLFAKLFIPQKKLIVFLKYLGSEKKKV